jgi:hypothetical protein
MMDKECHPFISEDYSFALLQNGTVPFANHMGAYLEVLGHKFSSGIDSEVLLHMLEDIIEKSKDRSDAFDKFWRASIGNILVLFADGELWGIADSLSFNVIIDRGNGAIYIASEMDSLTNALKETLTDKAEGLDTKGGTAIRLFNSKEKGTTYTLYGEWNKGLMKDGAWVFNRTTMCDFCRKSGVRCEDFKVNNISKDRCHDCFKTNVTIVPPFRTGYEDLSENHTVTHNVAIENIGTNNSEKLNVICSKCHLPHNSLDSVICSDCNKTFCTYCFTRHQCKDETPEPSQNIIKWLYNMISAETVSESY